jgi:hypothetical protein
MIETERMVMITHDLDYQYVGLNALGISRAMHSMRIGDMGSRNASL